jgi:replicative DNA helicase
MEVVNQEMLEAVAHMRPSLPPSEGRRGIEPIRNGHKKLDLAAWIEKHDLPVKREGPWSNDCYRYVLEECPWNGHTDNATYIVQLKNGAIAAGCHHNSCQGYSWQELRKHYEPSAYEGTDNNHSANSANSANGANEQKSALERWEPPGPFREFDLPTFPTESLPRWVREFVEAEAHATQTPVDLAAMLVLSVGALACAKLVEVEPVQGWREPTNLFTVTAMPPGSRKTKVFADVTTPVEEFEADLAKEKAPEIAEQQTKYGIYEGRLQKAQGAAAKAKGEELDQRAAEAMEAARDLASIKVPAEPRLLADAASPECLATLMRDQGGRMALTSAEGDVFEIMGGRYSQGQPNLGVYLKGHAGDSIRVDRVNRPSESIERPALTLGLAVQPEVLRGLANRPGFRGKGLLGRCLYSLPKNLLGSRQTVTTPVPEDVKRTYRNNVRKLLELAPEYVPEESLQPQTLRLGPDAQRKMEEFLAWIEPQLAEYGELGSMTDWAGKLAGAVARIAGVLHCMEHVSKAKVDKNPWDEEIDTDTLDRALEIGRYLIPHAQAAFAEMGADPTIEDAKHVLKWIEHKGIESFSKREAFEGTKGRFGKVSALDPALNLLVAHGFVREKEPQERTGPGRKPSPQYEVNPLMDTDKTMPTLCSQYSQNSHNNRSGGGEEE